MRKNTLLFAAALAAVPLFAEDDAPQSQPVENLYFSTDEYIEIPKYSFSYGYRALVGSKASFGGTSTVNNMNVTFDTITDEAKRNDPSTTKVYSDGYVAADTRTDGNGRDLPSDGTTLNWQYAYEQQVRDVDGHIMEAPGYVAFHSYTAEVSDTDFSQQDMGNSYGMELAVSRDVRKFGRYLQLKFTAGLSLNDITQGLYTNVDGTMTTITDYYYLFGKTPQDPGSTGSSSTTNSLDDATGTSSGSTQSVTQNTGISETPDAHRVVENAPISSKGSLKNRYKIKGSYYTLRAGPTIIVPFSTKFHLSFGVGAAFIYAGTTYSVESEFLPDDFEQTITKKDSSYDRAFRPGYYLDANLEYWISERSGLFAGAVFQSNGSYTQKVENDEENAVANYSSTIDLSSQSGMRLGMNIRF